MKINEYIEHTNLKPTVTQKEIEQLCQEAIEHEFVGVCVPPYWVKKVKRDLKNTDILVVTVIGFPLGYSMSQTKVAEIKQAIQDGADELDIVMNMTAFKSDSQGWAKIEVAQFAKIAHEAGKSIKMILETAYLTPKEIEVACKFCHDAGADFVKTSTGFAPEGATVENIALMKKAVGEQLGVKASGGIKTYEDALRMIQAGAERIGTSSGVTIMEQFRAGL
ncbi:MAG: deoxyribose-phosphate aldolase [Arenicella sp.]|jgi:deoxyribose-phosphate aldolase